MPSSVPLDKSLYERVKNEAKKRFHVWPSAYASGWLVKEYKRRGGRYSSSSSSDDEKPLERWFKEKWVDVCRLPTKVPCGKTMRHYPYCRPSKRINKDTPVTSTELTSDQIDRLCKLKNELGRLRMPNKKRNVGTDH